MSKQPNKKSNANANPNGTFSKKREQGGNKPNQGNDYFNKTHSPIVNRNKPEVQVPKQNSSMNQTVQPERIILEPHKITSKAFFTQGNKPQSRFGNSFSLLSPVKAILFGGAVGDVKNYKFSNDTYIFNLINCFLG